MSFRKDLHSHLRQSQHRKPSSLTDTSASSKSFEQFRPNIVCAQIAQQVQLPLQSQSNSQINFELTDEANNCSKLSDVYNVPWDIKVKLLQQQQQQPQPQQIQNNSPIHQLISLHSPVPLIQKQITPQLSCSSQDQYCAPWDLKLQEERLKQLSINTQNGCSNSNTQSVLNMSPPTPPILPPPPSIPIPPIPTIPAQISTTKPSQLQITENSTEYSPPWDQKQNILLNKKKCSLTSSNSSLSSSSTCSPTNTTKERNDIINPIPQQIQQKIIIIQPQQSSKLKSYSSSASNLQTASQQHQNLLLNNEFNIESMQSQLKFDKFCSLDSNSSSNQSTFDRVTSSFDDTKPLIKPRKNGSSHRVSQSPPVIITQNAVNNNTQLINTQQTPPPLPSTPAYMVVLERQPWYHGRITRRQAETLLNNKQLGSFLVRQSESGNTNDFSLSLVTTSGCVHMRICLNDDKFILGQCSQPFTSIIKMIEHFSKVEVPIKGAQHVKLTKPVTI